MADSKALLSQNEIDALVSFLNSQKETIGDEVMNQDSIDRLITMLNSGVDGDAILGNQNTEVIKDRSLLGQSEIDALVSFLTAHKESTDDVILTQDKIDKLVEMLTKQ